MLHAYEMGIKAVEEQEQFESMLVGFLWSCLLPYFAGLFPFVMFYLK